MTFIEPEAVYRTRITANPRIVSAPCELESAILEAIRSEEYPPLFMAVVNSLARDRVFASRSEREDFKIKVIRLMGRMVQRGILERVKRKLVNIPGRSFRAEDRFRCEENRMWRG